MNSDIDSLVTIDKIWQLEESIMPVSSKDLCLSFALFKILRCRFAGYTAAETGSTGAHNFFWQLLLTSNDDDHDRLLGVITDELSFLHDFYYSSVPISYSKRCLPILSFLISLFTICYCLLAGIAVTVFQVSAFQQAYRDRLEKLSEIHGWCQIFLSLICYNATTNSLHLSSFVSIGCLLYDILPIFLLLAPVVLAEAREIASCICSNWAKVALICRQLYSNQQLLLLYPRLQKCVSAVLRCRCNLVNPLNDRMTQCSIILPFHSRSRKGSIIGILLHHVLRQLGKKKRVKVPTAVKASIVNTLRSNNGQLSNGVGFLRRRRNLQEDHGGHNNDFFWACTDSKATADVILTWHIATSILEVKLHRHHPSSSSSSSDNQIIVATHLSRYCDYLVNCWPELLPDDDKWSKSLYDAVSADSMRVLAITSRGGYDEMVALLTEKSKHEVVKNGARLGKQLAQLEDEAAAWSLLAGVWSEMILYVAPSENLNAHSDAIARGGELITVVWALLMHLGIYTRPPADANSV